MTQTHLQARFHILAQHELSEAIPQASLSFMFNSHQNLEQLNNCLNMLLPMFERISLR